MEINKGKIFIYILTFAAYAWTGYGSDVLSHLKDAVLSAEGFFNDFLEKAVDAVKHVKNLKDKVDATIEEECIFHCPNGAKPKPNKYHKAVANGCGPEGMKVESDGLPMADMNKCCNEHDICYGTCNKDRDKCDLDFKRCLYKICDKTTDPLTVTTCKGAAKMLYTATTALGCSFFLQAQTEACFCGLNKKSKTEL